MAYCRGAATGSGTTMSHSGFTYPGNPNMDCVVFLFQSGVLNTPGKYAAATIGTIAMGLAFTGLQRLRYPRLGLETEWKIQLAELGVLTVQSVLGYTLMLIAMTFSVWLFLAVCFSLAAGHVCFHRESPARKSSTSETKKDTELASS